MLARNKNNERERILRILENSPLSHILKTIEYPAGDYEIHYKYKDRYFIDKKGTLGECTEEEYKQYTEYDLE